MGAAEPQGPLFCPGIDAGMFRKEVVDTPVTQVGVPRHIGFGCEMAFFGDDVDDASHGPCSVQGGLGALDHLDPLDVVDVDHAEGGGQVGGRLYPVAVDQRHQPVFTQPPDVDGRGPRPVTPHGNTGLGPQHVGKGLRRQLQEIAGAHHCHGQGNLLHPPVDPHTGNLPLRPGEWAPGRGSRDWLCLIRFQRVHPSARHPARHPEMKTGAQRLLSAIHF